jgi:hypothetical protein
MKRESTARFVAAVIAGHGFRKFLTQDGAQIQDVIIDLYDIGHKADAVAIVCIFASMDSGKWLKGLLLCSVPAIDRNCIRFDEQAETLDDVLFIDCDQHAGLPACLLQLILHDLITSMKILTT